jgi:hypothetical protein
LYHGRAYLIGVVAIRDRQIRICSKQGVCHAALDVLAGGRRFDGHGKPGTQRARLRDRQIHRWHRAGARVAVHGIVDDTDDCGLLQRAEPHGIHGQTERLLRAHETPHECFVDHNHRRTAVDITPAHIAPGDEPHAVRFEPSRRYRIDPRCLLRPRKDRPARHLNAVIPALAAHWRHE